MSASSSTNDLRNRIIFTILILAVYRFGTFVPLPGIDPEQLKIMMEGNQKGLLGMFNVFAGGAVSRMAIFALGIMPYISSAIIVQGLANDDVKIQVVHAAVGGVVLSDVDLASATNSLIIGFNVRADINAKRVAKRSNINIKYYLKGQRMVIHKKRL